MTTPLHVTIDHERCACGTAKPGEPHVIMTPEQLAIFDWPKERLAVIGLHQCEPCAAARVEYDQRGIRAANLSQMLRDGVTVEHVCGNSPTCLLCAAVRGAGAT